MNTLSQILANGILSFQSPFTSFQERSFPSTSVPIIAPLWFDYEIRRSSPIYYRIARDQNTLDRFASIITEKNPVFRTYRPRQCVIVTWSEAPPARAGSSTIKVSIMAWYLHLTPSYIIIVTCYVVTSIAGYITICS